MLPTDAQERKSIPVYSGFVAYFPHAIAEVAKLSKEGNDQHNPGTPLHWDRGKSGDERDALMRHVLDEAILKSRCDFPLDEAILEARAVAWRAMAHLEKLCECRNEIENSVPQKIAPAIQPCRRPGENIIDYLDRTESAIPKKWISPGTEAKKAYIESLNR